jgi:hypothetical protein
MTERVTHVVHLRDDLAVLQQICLDRVLSTANRFERQVDGDALMADARQDLGDRLDRLRTGGYDDLQPCSSRSARPARGLRLAASLRSLLDSLLASGSLVARLTLRPSRP